MYVIYIQIKPLNTLAMLIQGSFSVSNPYCTIVGFTSIRWISGAKGRVLELLVDFRQKDEKSTRGPKSQLVVNPDLRASTSQHGGPKVSRKRIPEVWSKVNLGQLQWSRSRQSQPCDSSRSFQCIMEYVRFGEVTPSLFLPFVSHKILPHCPSFTLLSHWI